MFEQHTTAESRIIQWRKLRQSAETEQDVLEQFAKIKNETENRKSFIISFIFIVSRLVYSRYLPETSVF